MRELLKRSRIAVPSNKPLAGAALMMEGWIHYRDTAGRNRKKTAESTFCASTLFKGRLYGSP